MTLIERLDNWGAVQRGGGRIGETASVEGEYRSPQHWHALGAPVTRAPVDPLDAAEIEGAVCTIDIYHHTILRAWHVCLYAEPRCLRLAAKAAGQPRGKSRGFDASLTMAYALLSTALTMPAVIRKARARDRVRAILGMPENPLDVVA